MIKYENEKDEMLYDVSKQHVQVYDVDCQGLFNLSGLETRFKLEFPETYNKYIRACLKQNNLPGRVMISTERGYKIALMFTTYARIGKQKDDPETVLTFTNKAIDYLKTSYPSVTFASSILNRHTQNWGKLFMRLKNDNINWVIHRS